MRAKPPHRRVFMQQRLEGYWRTGGKPEGDDRSRVAAACSASHGKASDWEPAAVETRAEPISLCRKRPFGTHGRGCLPASAAVCRIPCLMLCLADVERVCQCRAPNAPCGVRSRPPLPAGLHATTPSVGPDVRRHATVPPSWIQRENWEFETHRAIDRVEQGDIGRLVQPVSGLLRRGTGRKRALSARHLNLRMHGLYINPRRIITP